MNQKHGQFRNNQDTEKNFIANNIQKMEYDNNQLNTSNLKMKYDLDNNNKRGNVVDTDMTSYKNLLEA